MREFEKKILEIVWQNCDGGEQPKPDSALNALNLDSLSFVAILVGLEQEFGIEFEDEALYIDGYDRVSDLLVAVERLKN